DVYLRWMEAEDLGVGNFLQLQRQMDAAVQYGFGVAGEARRGNYMIRPGHESRSEFYGHINLLGGRDMIRPLSVGPSLANSPDAYPYPKVLFERGRKLGATVGYAHFNGSTPHSALMMDLVAGSIDFVEVFQFSVLKTEQWYELLNAGFRVTGIAGSDFPANMSRLKSGARTVPLLGPERTMVKARAGASSPYDVWAAGVRKGEAFVTNGPLIEIAMDPAGLNVTASAEFYRPLEQLEIVINGEVAVSAGDGSQKKLAASSKLPEGSCWVAARTRATAEVKGPMVQAHTNPLYRLRDGKPVLVGGARAKLAAQWETELKYYESAGLVFPGAKEKQEFFELASRTLAELRR
ncbi:MAG: CehA/McbA family metallohydrolase, partial [Bryobacteraceae bacterium]